MSEYFFGYPVVCAVCKSPISVAGGCAVCEAVKRAKPSPTPTASELAEYHIAEGYRIGARSTADAMYAVTQAMVSGSAAGKDNLLPILVRFNNSDAVVVNSIVNGMMQVLNAIHGVTAMQVEVFDNPADDEMWYDFGEGDGQ